MSSRSLKNLSIVALTRPFFDQWDKDEKLPRHFRARKSWPLAAIEYARKMQSLGLPAHLEIELRQVIWEFVIRQDDRKKARDVLKLSSEPPSRDKAMEEFLPAYFSAASGRKIHAPALLEYFPEKDHMSVITFFFALLKVNPRKDTGALRAFWTSAAFLPMQSIFLNNFADIWMGIGRDISDRLEVTTIDDEHCALSMLIEVMLPTMLSITENVTVPWFVFEVLSEEQRDKFFTLGQNDIMDSYAFRMFFASVFRHWPWKDEAFERYYAHRELLSFNETEVLFFVRLHHLQEENRAMGWGILPKKGCFAEKLDTLVKKRNRYHTWTRDMFWSNK